MMGMNWSVHTRLGFREGILGGPGYMSREERQAYRRAEAAAHAFRVSKGYEPDTFWFRLKQKLLCRESL